MCAWIWVIFYDGVKAESEQIQDFDVVKIENYLAENDNDYVEISEIPDDATNPLAPEGTTTSVSEYMSQEWTINLEEDKFDYNSLPKKYELYWVPFFSQAPDGNRNEPYQNACEEASIVLAYYYIKGLNPSKSQYRKDLLNLMVWEQENLWHHKDTTIQEFLILIKKYLSIQSSYILNNPSVNDIKKLIFEWKIIVAPFRGKMIGNPHYALGWPDYHVMVINWYTADKFITQDVGTIRWKDRYYDISTIMNAMGNGNKKELDKNEKRIIVMEK